MGITPELRIFLLAKRSMSASMLLAFGTHLGNLIVGKDGPVLIDFDGEDETLPWDGNNPEDITRLLYLGLLPPGYGNASDHALLRTLHDRESFQRPISGPLSLAINTIIQTRRVTTS